MQDYTIEEIPWRLILDVANILFPSEPTKVLCDEYLYMVPNKWQASIYNWRHHLSLCCCLYLTLAAAVGCHRCDLKLYIHPTHSHYDTVACTWRPPIGNIQRCVGYPVCCAMRDVFYCKSHDVEIDQDAVSVFDNWGKENGGVGGKNRYINSRSYNILVELVSLFNEHKMAQPSSCTTSRHLVHEEPRDEIHYSGRGTFATPGIALALYTTFTFQNPCIPE